MILARVIAFWLLALVATNPIPPWSGLPMRPAIRSGSPGDPVNIAFEGSRASILAAFRAIGWVPADPLSLRDDARLAVDAVLHHSYPTAPVSRLYLFGRQEDFAVEHELGSVAKRDHARLWDTKRQDPGTHLELWIGDASRDSGIEVLRRHGIPIGTTHHIDPDLDAERTRIVQALQATGRVLAVVMEPGIGPTAHGRNGGGDRFYTDGKVAVIVLKR